MKVYKINSKKDNKGFYPLPMNLLNRDMFSYPYYTTSEYDFFMNKKINAIVSIYGETTHQFAIGMMGHEYMLIFTYDKHNVQSDEEIYFYNFELHGDLLFQTKDETDYIKIKRYLKINKLIK